MTQKLFTRLVAIIVLLVITTAFVEVFCLFKSNIAYDQANTEAMAKIAKTQKPEFFTAKNFEKEFKKLLYETRKSMPIYKQYAKYENIRDTLTLTIWPYVLSLTFLFTRRVKYIMKYETVIQTNIPPFMGMVNEMMFAMMHDTFEEEAQRPEPEDAKATIIIVDKEETQEE